MEVGGEGRGQIFHQGTGCLVDAKNSSGPPPSSVLVWLRAQALAL